MMKRTVMLLFAFVAATVIMTGCKKMGPAGVATFKSPDGIFSVDIPARYKEMKKETSQIETPAGPKTLTVYSIDAKNTAYLVSFMELPAESALTNIKQQFEGRIKDIVDKDEKILSQKDAKLDNMLAIELETHKKFENKELYVRAIHSIIDGKQFKVQIVSYQKTMLDSPEMRRFLSSFKYTGWQRK